MTELDVEQGQIYSIAVDDGEGPVLAEFTKEPGDGTLVFERRKTGRPIYIEVGEFEDMRCDGRANLVPVYTIKSPNAPPVEDIDPIALADPHEPGITISESKKRLAAAARLLKARTLRFYVERFDQQPSLGRGAVKIRHFIAENYPDAFAKGFLWKPDPATLLRAADRCGETHNRPLAAFFDQRGKHDRTKRWSTEVTEAAAHMIALYWSKASVRQIDAISHFIDKVEGPDVPDDETLRLWIRQSESYENYREKFGELEADRRYRGRSRAVTATRPLEYVMIDHTRVDAWAVVLNDAGRPMLIERPWLTIAIDAYSRMVLGLVLTFEPPSVWSALECLKDVVRKKNYLIRRYGFHKGATDGWGRPYTVICDNGWEFTGLSFQMACEAAGIDVMWAPVKTPMFKAYVERMFGRLNDEVWHKLPSGIPFKPHVMSELKLDPKVKAVHTREQLEGAVWNAIVTIYHLEEHSGIGMAPAKKWREGLRAKSRATVADVSKLDALLGQVKRVQLSAEGVHLSNERFHDEEVTFDLLNRLLRYGKVREQRRNRLSSVRYGWWPR